MVYYFYIQFESHAVTVYERANNISRRLRHDEIQCDITECDIVEKLIYAIIFLFYIAFDFP